MKVSVNAPKTPVTAGSNAVAAATIPNVCKMPGPPAPFVPTPLPNIGKSGDSPKGYSKNVTIENEKVAIRGASFKSTGDMASKGTGGGLVSANTHGYTKFVGPGSMDVKIEGKNVQLLSDPMLNNCGPSGSPANSATLLGVLNPCGTVTAVEDGPCPICKKSHGDFKETEATKVSAATLSTNFQRELSAIGASQSTMLGVVQCKCNKKYADQSGTTRTELCNAAAAAGMRHPQGVVVSYRNDKKMPDEPKNRVKNGLWSHLGDVKAFRTKWHWASFLHKESAPDKTRPAAHVPGNCAAQGALLLLMNDQAIPAAMTEQFFDSAGGKISRAVEFVDNSEGKRIVTSMHFGHGETVPPCKSCELIIPFLLCPREKTSCEHKS